MKKEEILNIWYYYLSVEKDMTNTTEFLEPKGQEGTYSFAFYKIILLSCTKIETIFKIISREKNGNEDRDIRDYKKCLLNNYPKIVEAEVSINRLGSVIKPFSEWKEGDSSRLSWWKSYTNLKHNGGLEIKDATYKNAVYCLSALYILILYLARILSVDVTLLDGDYITSDYVCATFLSGANKELPDFEKNSKISENNL